jgi:phosphate transport system substrate-binding protein
MREYDCREAERDLQVPIPVDDRDYVAELGYVTPDGNWLKLARSEHVRVPACSPTGELLDTGRENLSIGAGTALAGATALAAGAAATVGGLLDRDRPTVPEPVETLANDLGSRIVLVPRNCRKAYAYWELSETDKARLSGDRLVLRVYDVTDIELNFQSAHNVQEFECSAPDRDLVVPIATDNRDYLAEIGIVTPDGAWSPIARSEHVRVPACPPGSGLVDNARESLANVTETLPERVTDARQNISNTFTNVTENLSERLTDARETLSDTFTNVTKSEEAPAFQAGVSLTESLPESVTDALENLAGVAAFGAGAVAAARSRFGDDRQDSETERSEGQIVYVPRDSQEAYIYWEISDTTKAAVRSRENDRLALRIYDLTDSNDDGTPDSVWEYEIEESDRDKTIPIHRHDRHYAAELGYRTEEGRWLAIARSESVYVPTPPEPEA